MIYAVRVLENTRNFWEISKEHDFEKYFNIEIFYFSTSWSRDFANIKPDVAGK